MEGLHSSNLGTSRFAEGQGEVKEEKSKRSAGKSADLGSSQMKEAVPIRPSASSSESACSEDKEAWELTFGGAVLEDLKQRPGTGQLPAGSSQAIDREFPAGVTGDHRASTTDAPAGSSGSGIGFLDLSRGIVTAGTADSGPSRQELTEHYRSEVPSSFSSR